MLVKALENQILIGFCMKNPFGSQEQEQNSALTNLKFASTSKVPLDCTTWKLLSQLPSKTTHTHT